MEKIIVLGSTGSIGVNTLKIAKQFNIQIDMLVAGENINLLNEQLKEFSPRVVVIKNKEDINKVNHHNVLHSQEAILDEIEKSNAKIVVNALVGFSGLKPSITSINSNKTLALANKESLVIAGNFLDTSKIIPIDSEHFGLWYLIDDKKISNLTITASGGSFRDTNLEKLQNVSVKEALNHPNWSMGKKITIDSATMVNKLFEILEAYHLFKIKNINAVIEKKSLIHAIVEFIDGSSTAHFAYPDMKLPIAYALGIKNTNIIKPLNLLEIGCFEFKEIQTNRYPIWKIKDLLLNKPNLGVVINRANEEAVKLFLNEKIKFLDISKIILKALKEFENIKINSLDDIYIIDKEIKKFIFKNF